MSSRSHYSRISLHLMTLSVLNFLYVKFLWSIYTLICCPNNIFLNSFSVSTVESYSRSVVVSLICAGLSFLLYNTVGLPFD